MKMKKLVIALLITALLAAAIPAVYAYMFRSTETFNNTFEPANVSCQLVETFGKNGDVQEKTSVMVKNTSNIEAYLRVRFVIHWEDSKGNVVSRDIDPPAISINTGKWIQAPGDKYTFYCKEPIQPGELTPELLAQGISMLPVNEPFEGVDYHYYPVIEIITEAIQSKPADAVKNSWKVTLDGVMITGVAVS